MVIGLGMEWVALLIIGVLGILGAAALITMLRGPEFGGTHARPAALPAWLGRLTWPCAVLVLMGLFAWLFYEIPAVREWYGSLGSWRLPATVLVVLMVFVVLLGVQSQSLPKSVQHALALLFVIAAFVTLIIVALLHAHRLNPLSTWSALPDTVGRERPMGSPPPPAAVAPQATPISAPPAPTSTSLVAATQPTESRSQANSTNANATPPARSESMSRLTADVRPKTTEAPRPDVPPVVSEKPAAISTPGPPASVAPYASAPLRSDRWTVLSAGPGGAFFDYQLPPTEDAPRGVIMRAYNGTRQGPMFRASWDGTVSRVDNKGGERITRIELRLHEGARQGATLRYRWRRP